MRQTPERNGQTKPASDRPLILHIRPETLHSILTGAKNDYPYECCGVLVGSRIGNQVYVQRAVAGVNITTGNRQCAYQLDWQTLFSTIRTARESGDDIVGFYHSHPNGPLTPSSRDLEAAWLDHSYLILTTPFECPQSVASWRMFDARTGFVGEQLRITSNGIRLRRSGSPPAQRA